MLDASERALVFEGPVQCLAQPRAGDWRLRGRLHGVHAGKTSAPVEVLLSGVRGATTPLLPPRLHELRGRVVAPLPQRACAYGLHLDAREGSFTVEVKSLRVHHDASQGFYRALPPISLPLRTRAGWATLLTLLRVPLIARLLTRTATHGGLTPDQNETA